MARHRHLTYQRVMLQHNMCQQMLHLFRLSSYIALAHWCRFSTNVVLVKHHGMWNSWAYRPRLPYLGLRERFRDWLGEDQGFTEDNGRQGSQNRWCHAESYAQCRPRRTLDLRSLPSRWSKEVDQRHILRREVLWWWPGGVAAEGGSDSSIHVEDGSCSYWAQSLSFQGVVDVLLL